MDQGQSIESPMIQRSDVVEKRMEMVAMLLNRLNEEANLGQTMNQDEEAEEGNHKQLTQAKGWLNKMFNAVRANAK